MRYYTAILIYIFSTSLLLAQEKRDYVWHFCNQNVTEPFSKGAFIDFTKQPFRVDTMSARKMRFSRTNASICDREGNLLFYTNGCWIANAEHELMLNGDDINAGILHDAGCKFSGYSSKDGALILPMPEHDSLYYLFHYTELGTDTFDGAKGLYYTLVNMNLDGGLGGVVEKNQPVYDDWVWNEELQAVRHANNRDWWILTQKRPYNTYLRYLLTPNGIEGPWEQDIGPIPPDNETDSGQVRFSPDGTKYGRYLKWQQVLLYDFERETGLLSNMQHYTVVDEGEADSGGLAFSPSGRFLYISNGDTIWQFDLQAMDIQASRTVVAVFDGYSLGGTGNFFTQFKHMQLGPDCRIYITTPTSARSLHVINYPDEKGLACEVVQRGVNLYFINNISLPNFPNYRLGTGYPVCDSSLHSVAVSARPIAASRGGLGVWPNPARDVLQVSLPAGISSGAELRLYDATGRVLRQWPVERGASVQQLSLGGLPPGLYVLQLQDAERGLRLAEKVVVQ